MNKWKINKWFELEKKEDGLYRCKGGWLADILLLLAGMFYALLLYIFQIVIAILTVIISLFKRK